VQIQKQILVLKWEEKPVNTNHKHNRWFKRSFYFGMYYDLLINAFFYFKNTFIVPALFLL